MSGTRYSVDKKFTWFVKFLMTPAQLEEVLKRLHLPSTGTKRDLIESVLDYYHHLVEKWKHGSIKENEIRSQFSFIEKMMETTPGIPLNGPQPSERSPHHHRSRSPERHKILTVSPTRPSSRGIQKQNQTRIDKQDKLENCPLCRKSLGTTIISKAQHLKQCAEGVIEEEKRKDKDIPPPNSSSGRSNLPDEIVPTTSQSDISLLQLLVQQQQNLRNLLQKEQAKAEEKRQQERLDRIQQYLESIILGNSGLPSNLSPNDGQGTPVTPLPAASSANPNLLESLAIFNGLLQSSPSNSTSTLFSPPLGNIPAPTNLPLGASSPSPNPSENIHQSWQDLYERESVPASVPVQNFVQNPPPVDHSNSSVRGRKINRRY